MGGLEDPLPNLTPTLPPLPGPHLLQAAGVQLGFVDDFDGNLEVKEVGGRSGYPNSRSPGMAFLYPLSQKNLNLGHPSG